MILFNNNRQKGGVSKAAKKGFHLVAIRFERILLSNFLQHLSTFSVSPIFVHCRFIPWEHFIYYISFSLYEFPISWQREDGPVVARSLLGATWGGFRVMVPVLVLTAIHPVSSQYLIHFSYRRRLHWAQEMDEEQDNLLIYCPLKS